MSFSHTIELIIYFVVLLLSVSFFPFETLIVFSLVSNLFVFRFLFLFFERSVRDALQRSEPRGQAQAGPEQVD